jgi:hypothetical protein
MANLLSPGQALSSKDQPIAVWYFPYTKTFQALAHQEFMACILRQ